MRAGGSAGNRQLTALVAAILVLLLAIEGATLLRLGSLLTVHAFVGMLLIPIVALKLASTGWRMLRLIENMTLGRNAVGYLTESMHGAGSPQAPTVVIHRRLRTP